LQRWQGSKSFQLTPAGKGRRRGTDSGQTAAIDFLINVDGGSFTGAFQADFDGPGERGPVALAIQFDQRVGIRAC
jgi:hypothetical protein